MHAPVIRTPDREPDEPGTVGRLTGNFAQVAGIEAADALRQRAQTQPCHHQPAGSGTETARQLDDRDHQQAASPARAAVLT